MKTIEEVMNEMSLEMDDIRAVMKMRNPENEKEFQVHTEDFNYEVKYSHGFIIMTVNNNTPKKIGKEAYQEIYISAFTDRIEEWQGIFAKDIYDCDGFFKERKRGDIEQFKIEWVEPE